MNILTSFRHRMLWFFTVAAQSWSLWFFAVCADCVQRATVAIRGSARTTRTKGAEAASGKGPASGAARCGSVRLGSGGSTAPPGGVLSVSNVFFL